METLISELFDEFDQTSAKLTELKQRCQQNPEDLKMAFELIFKALGKRRKLSTRLNSLRLLNELFVRSHQFRLLVLGKSTDIVDLVFDSSSKELKQLGTEHVYWWVQQYGGGYQRLVLLFRYLRYVKQVDFGPVSRKYKQSRLEWIQRQRKQRQDYVYQCLLAVSRDFTNEQNKFREAVSVLRQCFGLLVPSLTDMFTGVTTSSVNIADDDDEVMAVMAANRHAIDLDFDPRQLVQVKETPDNAGIFTTIRDYLRLCIEQYQPQISGWISRLDKIIPNVADAEEAKGLMDSIQAIKRQIQDVVAKCKDMKIDLPVLGAEESEDDGFEDVSETVVEQAIERKRKAQGTSMATSSSFGKQNPVFSLLGEPELASDPTYINPKRLRPPEPQPKAKTEEMETNPIEDKLRRTAPVVPFGSDLLYWNDEGDKMNANTTGLEIRHRFLGSARDEPTVSEERLQMMRQRGVFLKSTEEQKTIKACRAPLKSGRLCPRRDRTKCPFHGLIIPRDEMGKPADGSEIEKPVAEERQSTVATAQTVEELEWQDLEPLVKKKQKQTPEKKPPAKKKTGKGGSSLQRLRKRVFGKR